MSDIDNNNTPEMPEGQSGLSTTRMIFRNTAFGTIGVILLKLINFIFNVYVVRQLGDHRFGQYSIVLAFVGLFQIFAELGMSQYVMREIARDVNKAKTYTWNLIAMRILLALVAMVTLPVIARAWGYSSELVIGIFAYSASFVLAAFAIPFGDILAAEERMGHVTAINVIGQIVFVVLGTIFLFSGLGYIWLIVAGLLSTLPRIILSIVYLRKLNIVELPFHLDVRTWGHIIRAGLPFGITSLMQSIAFSLDTVIISWYQPESHVGWYNVAYNLIFSIVLLFGGFKTALLPSLSKVFVKDRSRIDSWYRATFKFSFMFGLPIAVGGMILAFPLVTFLYTWEFAPAALALQILIWDLPFLLYTSIAGDMSIIIGEERSAARINIVNTIANTGLNILLIPLFGIIGAAFVTVITDMVSALQFHLLLRGKLNLPDMRIPLFKVAGASAIMAAAVLLFNPLNFHVILNIVLGGLVYVVMTFLLRLYAPGEIDLARQFLSTVPIARRFINSFKQIGS